MTDYQQFQAMLARAGIGHGSRIDYNPPGTAVQVEAESGGPPMSVDFWFDEAGTLKSVHVGEMELG